MPLSSQLIRLLDQPASDAALSNWLRENHIAVIEALEMEECTDIPIVGVANEHEPELPL